MWIIWWGDRCYLVTPERRVEFVVSALTHRWPEDSGGRDLPAALREPRSTRTGWMYLQDGDWLLPVSGQPVVPAPRPPPLWLLPLTMDYLSSVAGLPLTPATVIVAPPEPEMQTITFRDEYYWAKFVLSRAAPDSADGTLRLKTVHRNGEVELIRDPTSGYPVNVVIKPRPKVPKPGDPHSTTFV